MRRSGGRSQSSASITGSPFESLFYLYCSAVVPLLALTIGLYVAARCREERQAEDEAEWAAADGALPA